MDRERTARAFKARAPIPPTRCIVLGNVHHVAMCGVGIDGSAKQCLTRDLDVEVNELIIGKQHVAN